MLQFVFKFLEKTCYNKKQIQLKRKVYMNIVMLLKPKCDVAFLYEDNTLRQGLEKMRYHGYTAIPVIARDGTYVGTVSEGDFFWSVLDNGGQSLKDEEKYTVRDILKAGWNPAVRVNITMDALLLKAMDQNFVPVTDDRGSFMGIVTRRDVLKYFYQNQWQEEKRPLQAVAQ